MLPIGYNFTLLLNIFPLKAKRNEKFFIFASSYRLYRRSFYSFKDIYCVAARAASSPTGLFLFHKSSLGQSYTNGAVTSRRTENKVTFVYVKSSAGRQHYPGRAYADTPSALMLWKYRICVIGGVLIIFFMGFGVISNTSYDLASSTRNPLLLKLRTLPSAAGIKLKTNIMTLRAEFTVTNPFSPAFVEHWEFWKLYKKQDHDFTYRSSMSEQAGLNELVRLSDGDEQEAIRIIERSMSNGWKGLFRIHKSKKDAQPTKPKSTGKATTDDLYAAYIKPTGTEGI